LSWGGGLLLSNKGSNWRPKTGGDIRDAKMAQVLNKYAEDKPVVMSSLRGLTRYEKRKLLAS